MPHRIYAHPCCPDASGRRPGRVECHTCGRPGIPDGWGLSVIEHWGAFQRAWGLRAMGPHMTLARKLLGDFRENCRRCGGSGYVGWEFREICPACDGGGGIWRGDEDQIRAAYLKVLEEYPEAAAPGALAMYAPGSGMGR